MKQLAFVSILIFVFLQYGKPIDGRKVRECDDPTWKTYKNDRCFKVLDILMTKADGQAACSKEIQHSFEDPLLTVKSESDQNFIAEWLFDKEGRSQNVWLAAHRMDSSISNEIWKWDDDNTTVQYFNWERGSKPISKEGENCLKILWKDEDPTSSDPDTVGRWRPTSCSSTNNLVVCQKSQVSSQYRAIEEYTKKIKQDSEKGQRNLAQKLNQTQLKSQKLEIELAKTKKGLETIQLGNNQTKELLKEISLENQSLKLKIQAVPLALNQTNKDLLNTQSQLEEASLKISQITKNVQYLEQKPVPLGFVYTQFGGQPDPSVIWPGVTWTQVTQDYAGLFFRAEGGNSTSFGQSQSDQSPGLSRVVYTERIGNFWEPKDISVPERGASANIYTGSDAEYKATWDKSYRFFLSFHNSGGEVRPKNQAIRLWKRTA